METQTTVKIIPFRPEHLDVADTVPKEIGHLKSLSDFRDRLLVFADGSQFSTTLMYRGRILCCAGFYEHWPGVAEAWIFPTIYIRKYPVVYLRTVKRYFDSIMKSFNYHRMQTSCIDDLAHAKWMKFLGFKREGILEKYTAQKANFIQYAKVI